MYKEQWWRVAVCVKCNKNTHIHITGDTCEFCKKVKAPPKFLP
jgi:hypothetical protein